jgi:hypothetical protein
MLEHLAVHLGTLSLHDPDGDPKDRWRGSMSLHTAIGVSQGSEHDMIPDPNVTLYSSFLFTPRRSFTLVHLTAN